jgi:molybdenum cofactor cytidylyltransferase
MISETELAALPVHIVENPDCASGMASSLIAVVSNEIAAAAEGLLVMLVDMPSISVPDLDSMVAAFQ